MSPLEGSLLVTDTGTSDLSIGEQVGHMLIYE